MQNLTPLTSMLGNFLMTSLIDDSSDLSDKNAGLEFASPHAYVKTVLNFKRWTTPSLCIPF